MSDLKSGICDIDELIEVYDAMIRFHFKENPELLSDIDYASRIKELKWLADEGFLKGNKKE